MRERDASIKTLSSHLAFYSSASSGGGRPAR
jgi:hypothetical protein